MAFYLHEVHLHKLAALDCSYHSFHVVNINQRSVNNKYMFRNIMSYCSNNTRQVKITLVSLQVSDVRYVKRLNRYCKCTTLYVFVKTRRTQVTQITSQYMKFRVR